MVWMLLRGIAGVAISLALIPCLIMVLVGLAFGFVGGHVADWADGVGGFDYWRRSRRG